MSDAPQYSNRLIYEKSPYLLQHAHNPVDWYPWGEDAFEKSQLEDKPIFLSIGYATCHWCHVMETESFENIEVAQLMNEAFVNVKVDREELPEVDSLYMEFAQSIMSGSAGWPLNLLLTPQLHPFFAMTYLPPYAVSGMTGMVDLVAHIRKVWDSPERSLLITQAEKMVQIYEDAVHVEGSQLPEKVSSHIALETILKISDTIYGGIKGAPKFPVGFQINFLLHYFFLNKDTRALFIAERTLEMMHRGGIYDHLGGGFSRYSVDPQWIVPHFEKMLYDNALLIESYLDAWRLTRRSLYRSVTDDIIGYVLENLSDSEGGFYSAEDADSEGVEGKFYAWTFDEIEDVLGEEDAEIFCGVYGVTGLGNFDGKNILHLHSGINEYARDFSFDVEELERKLEVLRSKLKQVRSKRVHPQKDDKVLTAWNGLMIHAIIEAGSALGNHEYLQIGAKAAQFIKNHLWKSGRLFRRFRDGGSAYKGGLSDYASMIRAALSLFEAGLGIHWLQWAIEMEEILRIEFKAEGGGFYQTDGKDPHLILRQCQFADEAEPSGNALHCENLLRLHLMTQDPVYLQQAQDILKAVKKYLDSYPPGYTFHLRNILRFYQPEAPLIVVALNAIEEYRDEIRDLLFRNFIPHRAIVWRPYNENSLSTILPAVKGYAPLKGKTTVYICHNRICELPLTDISEIALAIEKLL
jgi:uncharacterized protein